MNRRDKLLALAGSLLVGGFFGLLAAFGKLSWWTAPLAAAAYYPVNLWARRSARKAPQAL